MNYLTNPPGTNGIVPVDRSTTFNYAHHLGFAPTAEFLAWLKHMVILSPAQRIFTAAQGLEVIATRLDDEEPRSV